MNRWFLALGIIVTLVGPAMAGDRRIEREVTVAAPRHEIWHAWTTVEGVTSFAPQAAQIELKLDGMYEWYFAANAPAGKRGSEGCKVLAYHPMELLAFSWNAPPSIPALRDAGARTQVFVRLDEVSPKETKVRLTHLISGDGEDWDKYQAYFEKAWPNVLAKLKQELEKPGRPARPAPAPQTDVAVQTYEVNAPAEKVYAAAADPALAKQWMAKQVVFDMKPGGQWSANYDASAAPDADSWIRREVLAVEPGRLIAVKMVRAPAKFPYKKAIEGTWHVFYYDPLPGNRTRLRIVHCGLRNDDLTKEMTAYFAKANPGVLEKMKQVVGDTK